MILGDYCRLNNIQLVVADDNSTDKSTQLCKDLRIPFCVNNGEAKGFAANVNSGINFVLKNFSVEYLAIANTDIDFDKDLLGSLSEIIGAVPLEMQPLGILGFKETNSIDDKVIHNKTFDYSVVREVPGFFILIPKRTIDLVGYWDEEYFMYGEDNDYFYRVRKSGLNIVRVDRPVLHYSEGSSLEEENRIWLVYRNSILFARKNLSALELIWYYLRLLRVIFTLKSSTSDPSNNRLRTPPLSKRLVLLLRSIKYNYF